MQKEKTNPFHKQTEEELQPLEHSGEGEGEEHQKCTLAVDQLEHPATAQSVQTHTTSFRQNIPFPMPASGIKGYLCLIARIPAEQTRAHTSANPSTLDFTA